MTKENPQTTDYDYLLNAGWMYHGVGYWSIDGCESMSFSDALNLQKGTEK